MNQLQAKLIREEYERCHAMVEELNKVNGLPIIRYEYVQGMPDRDGFKAGYLKRTVINGR